MGVEQSPSPPRWTPLGRGFVGVDWSHHQTLLRWGSWVGVVVVEVVHGGVVVVVVDVVVGVGLQLLLLVMVEFALGRWW